MKKSKYFVLFSNITYFLLSSISVKVIGYILMPIYTSSMSTEEYGIADLLLSTRNLLYPIIALGITGAVMRFCADDQKDVKLVFTSGLLVLSVNSAFSVIVIPVFKYFYEFENYIFYLPIWALLVNLLNMFSALCKAFNRTKIIVRQNVIYSFLMLFCAIFFIKYLQLGVDGFIWSYFVAYLVSIIYVGVKIHIRKYLDFKYSKKRIVVQIKELLKYGIPLVPNSMAWWITQISDRYMVAYWYGAAANGLYSAAYKIPSILTTFINVFIQAWQLSSIYEYQKKDSIKFYNNIYGIYCTACYIGTSVLIIFTKLFAKILYINTFYGAWKYVPMLLLAAAVGSQESYFGSFYLADKRTNIYFVSSLIGACLNILLNFLLIPTYAAKGATIATAISYYIIYFQRAVDVHKRYGIDIKFKKNICSTLLLTMEAVVFVVLDDFPQMCYGICTCIIISICFVFGREMQILVFELKKHLCKKI